MGPLPKEKIFILDLGLLNLDVSGENNGPRLSKNDWSGNFKNNFGIQPFPPSHLGIIPKKRFSTFTLTIVIMAFRGLINLRVSKESNTTPFPS